MKDISVHSDAHIYALTIDSNGRLYSSSCDGSIKFIDNPLESDDAKILLQHENEIEALFTENTLFYCGDAGGGVTCFEDGKFKFKMNIVEAVKSLFVEGNLVYTLLNLDLSIHEVRASGNYSHVGSVPGKYPVTLFGSKVNGRSSYIAILTRDGKGVTIIGNLQEDKYKKITVKENMHEMIVFAVKGYNNCLFSADYAGKLMKCEMCGDSLKEISSGDAESGCINSIAVLDENTIFIGCSDGTVKKVIF